MRIWQLNGLEQRIWSSRNWEFIYWPYKYNSLSFTLVPACWPMVSDHLSIQIITNPSLGMFSFVKNLPKILQAKWRGGRGGSVTVLVGILQLKELRQSFKWKRKGAWNELGGIGKQLGLHSNISWRKLFWNIADEYMQRKWLCSRHLFDVFYKLPRCSHPIVIIGLSDNYPWVMGQ